MEPLYLKWNKNIKEEYSKQGLKILYKTLDNMDEFFNAPKSNDSINISIENKKINMIKLLQKLKEGDNHT